MDRLEVLVQENNRVGASMSTHYASLDRVIGLGLIILGGGAAFSDHVGPIAAIGVPIGIAIVTLFAIDTVHEIVTASGYKRVLEAKINAELQHADLVWDSWIVPPINHRGRGKIFLLMAFALTVVVAAIVSIITALRHEGEYETHYRIGTITFWASYAVVATISLIECFRSADTVEHFANSAKLEDLPKRMDKFKEYGYRRCLRWRSGTNSDKQTPDGPKQGHANASPSETDGT